MKVFKFWYDDCYTTFSGIDQQKATDAFKEYVGDDVEIAKVEEIPETEWDKKFINIYPDDDIEQEPFKASIRECMLGEVSTMIFSNDPDLID